MTDAGRKLWDLRFTVEVAARYHDWRRGTFGTYVNIVRAVTLGGAVLAFLAFNITNQHTALIVNIMTAAIAVVSLFDLVFGFDAIARKHDELYRRCKDLEAAIAKRKEGDDVADLESEAKMLWRDEPPIYWAIYAACWNQIADKYQSGIDFKKKVGFFKRLVGSFIQFTPQDFAPA